MCLSWDKAKEGNLKCHTFNSTPSVFNKFACALLKTGSKSSTVLKITKSNAKGTILPNPMFTLRQCTSKGFVYQILKKSLLESLVIHVRALPVI